MTNRRAACALGLSTALSLFVAPLFAAEEEARVLILNGLDPNLPAYVAIDSAMRANLSDESSKRIVYFSESLDAQRFSAGTLEPELLALLTKKYSALHVDVVVAISRPAIEFLERHGKQLWPRARVVYEDSVVYVGPVGLSPNAADVLEYPSEAETIALARRLQPDAHRIVVISGASDLDKSSEQLARNALSMSAEQLPVEFLSGLPLQELLVRVAAEPADTIIIYLSEFRDRDDRPYTPREILRAISRISVAPVYGTAETYVGFGIAAGSMESFEDTGRLVAEQVRAALAGAPSDPSRVLPKRPDRCIADARALQHWSLDKGRLPDGCEIRFAEQSLWRQYGWQIAVALVIIAGQSALIAALLAQRRRRRVAEAESRKRLSEIAHMNRRVSMGELSASIAHEIKQPLAAIQYNADAAEALIRGGSTNLKEIAEIVDDIKRDIRSATNIINRIRNMLRKTEFEARKLDLNEAIGEIMSLVAGEALVRKVSLKAELEPGLQKVSADDVQIQQVIVNLAFNGMEAMDDLPAEKRILTIRSKRANDREAEVSVADSGAGIAEESIHSIFDAFVTTKSDGMGMGLAISRTIIEAHRGQIRAENSSAGGAVFYFTLPFAVD